MVPLHLVNTATLLSVWMNDVQWQHGFDFVDVLYSYSFLPLQFYFHLHHHRNHRFHIMHTSSHYFESLMVPTLDWFVYKTQHAHFLSCSLMVFWATHRRFVFVSRFPDHTMSTTHKRYISICIVWYCSVLYCVNNSTSPIIQIIPEHCQNCPP